MGNTTSSSGSESDDNDIKDPKELRKQQKKREKERKKTLEKQIPKTYTVDHRYVRNFDTQIICNHGRVHSLTKQVDGSIHIGDSVYDEDGRSNMSNNSIKIAARNFAESLKVIQNDDQPLLALTRMTHFDMQELRALQSVFDSIACAEANDNLISANELFAAIGANKNSLLGKALFRLMDITRSGQINFRTWVVMLSALSPEALIDEKIKFAFNLYDDNGDGFIDKNDIVHLLTSAIADLTVEEAKIMINKAFEQADQDKDSRINISDYQQLANGSDSFFHAFTIDIAGLLAHYNIISQEEIAHRVHKLKERDLRHDEKINAPSNQAKDKAFMEREEDDLQVVFDVDLLDID